ncbi:MAG: hypothetical protein IH597_16210 [Bacteroidales bacterium]|nr:hypothetical protein [Bacteroidales bacterium]
MKKHRTSIFILIILSVIAIIFVVSRTGGTFKQELQEFAISDTSNVVKIFLSDKSDNDILLERQANGRWLANGEYLVRKDMIDILLATMKNLRVAAPVPRAAYNTVVGNLAARSTKVEIYQRSYLIDLFYRIRLFPRVKQTRVYYVGDITPDNIGTHMLLENSSMPFVVYWPGFRGFIASRYTTRLNDWRDHSIFTQKYLQIASVEVFFPSIPEQSYKVVNNPDGFMDIVPYGQESPIHGYDTLKMLGFITAFEDIRYEALVDDMDMRIVDSITSSEPLHIITLSDVYGKKTQVKTFRRQATDMAVDLYGQQFDYDPDRMFALINNDEDFVLVQYFTFNRIVRPFRFFLNDTEN